MLNVWIIVVCFRIWKSFSSTVNFRISLEIFINFSISVVIEMMSLGTEKAFNKFGACLSFVLGCPEAHEAGIVLLALVFFLFGGVLLNSAVCGVVGGLHTKYTVFRP